jgi:hypothetical protein
LFSAATYREKFWAWAAVPLSIFLGDLLIWPAGGSLQDAFQPLFTAFNYAGILSIVVCGALIQDRRSWLQVGGASISGGILFYVISNYASWLGDPQMPSPVGYSRDLVGLIDCYVQGIPFAWNSFAALLLFSAAMFSPLGVGLLSQEYRQKEAEEHTAAVPAVTGESA